MHPPSSAKLKTFKNLNFSGLTVTSWQLHTNHDFKNHKKKYIYERIYVHNGRDMEAFPQQWSWVSFSTWWRPNLYAKLVTVPRTDKYIAQTETKLRTALVGTYLGEKTIALKGWKGDETAKMGFWRRRPSQLLKFSHACNLDSLFSRWRWLKYPADRLFTESYSSIELLF